MEATNVCPSCDGKKKTFVIGIRYPPGKSGPYSGYFDCRRCAGIGHVTDEQLQWIEHGMKLRDARIGRGLTLRKVSDVMRIEASVVSSFERGMVSNLHVDPETWGLT